MSAAPAAAQPLQLGGAADGTGSPALPAGTALGNDVKKKEETNNTKIHTQIYIK